VGTKPQWLKKSSPGVKKPTAAKRNTRARPLRSWRIPILRERLRYLGTVDARDEKTAAKAAVKMFDLDDEQRKRLVLQEREP
jgi:hypothetical protein